MSDYSYNSIKTSGKYTYKPVNRLANATIILLAIYVFISLIGLWSNGVEYSILQDWENATEREINISDIRQGIIGGFQLILFIAYLVIFLIWLNRYSKNTHAMSKSNLTYTPGWTVGYFFIPIMSLFRPYQALSELYMENVKNNNTIISAWWGTWLISIVISRISFKTSMKAETISELQRANIFTIISDSSDIICLSFLMYVVWTMTKHQIAKRQAVVHQAPPPEIQSAQNIESAYE